MEEDSARSDIGSAVAFIPRQLHPDLKQDPEGGQVAAFPLPLSS
jgi:hypothetical protein